MLFTGGAGAKGEQGVMGLPGSSIKGEKGDAGAPGNTGTTGSAGPDGEPGVYLLCVHSVNECVRARVHVWVFYIFLVQNASVCMIRAP